MIHISKSSTAFTQAATNLSETLKNVEDALFSLDSKKEITIGEFRYARIRKEWGFLREDVELDGMPLAWKTELVDLLPQFIEDMTGELEKHTEILNAANEKAKSMLENLMNRSDA